MDDLSGGGDDLLSRISRNVEANLDSFQQRSAWETASAGQFNADPKSSTKLGDHDSTLQASLSINRSRGTDMRDLTSNSMSSQQWPSPVGAGANNFRSVGDTSRLKDLSEAHNSQGATLKKMPRPSSDKKYQEESTFMRTDCLRSSSILRLTDILCQNILLHPFVSLRRTCQVNRKCSPFITLQPFSLAPFIYHQQKKQGLSGLYKGLSSELLVKGMALATETALANHLEWPQEISSRRYIEDSTKVLVLRGLSHALITPFLCTTVIETVQSVIVLKDRPSFIDCLRDGFLRLIHVRLTPSARMLPIWLLVVPTVFYHVSHLALWHLVRKCVDTFKCSLMGGPSKSSRSQNARVHQTSLKHSINIDSNWEQDSYLNCDPNDSNLEGQSIEKDSSQISTSIIASLVADVTLLPIETVLNRLYIQGTRTIIDNCDETTVVLPVLTNYEGFSDCYQSILKFEGNLGLYKGLGAIMLQYSVHFLLFRSLYYLLRELRSKKDTFDEGNRSRISQPAVAPRANSEFLSYPGNNRHSTPTYPIGRNRFPEVRYDDYGTN